MMTSERVLRFEVPNRELLEQMAAQPLPTGLSQTEDDMRFFRVVYFDTANGDLDEKGATVRLEIDDRGRQTLAVDVRDHVTDDGAADAPRPRSPQSILPSCSAAHQSPPASCVRSSIHAA